MKLTPAQCAARRLQSLRDVLCATFEPCAPMVSEPWTDARVIALLTKLRAAESFIGDPLLGEAVGAIEWLMEGGIPR